MIELDLMEKYHWLPQDIRKIPYKDLQFMAIANKQRHQAVIERHNGNTENKPMPEGMKGKVLKK
jgi:hypothetical protein